MHRLVLAVATLGLWTAAHTLAGPADDFGQLLQDHWEWKLKEDPVFASRLGDRRYNQHWRDLSLAAFERRHRQQQDFFRQLKAIDTDQLSSSDQLNYQLFARGLEDQLEGYQFKNHLMPLSQRGGLQTLDSTTEQLRMVSMSDYEDWLARMATINTLVEQTIALLEEGRKSGYTAPRILMERLPNQIDAQLVDTAEESPFYAPFKLMLESIDRAAQARIRAQAKRLIANSIIPAYRRFSEYFNEVYLPACRESIAASALPNGRAFYEYRTRSFTTTLLSPDEVHKLGLAEVERIREEMQAIIYELEFDGSFADFLQFLRSDPRFYYETPEALFEGYLAVTKRIDPQLVKLFGKLPRMPYGLRPIPENIAADTTTAYYNRPAADGSRAGYYYVNLYRPEVRPRYEMEVLSVHEAVPGHHLQIALQMELEELPNFRKYSGFTAFTEGWGLYSESLGYELGLYQDPYSRFGALTYDMWRAVRLVVDTGMHYKGWSRQQAINFFKENAAKTETDIVNEIDRYISWPGQALAYKIGQLKMLELRRKSEQTLGESFDIRAFHDELLGGGALPLQVLETRMDSWLQTQSRQSPRETPQ